MSMNGESDFEVHAGDRMPYFLLEDKSIYDRLHEPKFHLLTFTNEPDEHKTTQNEIQSEFKNLIDYDVLPLTSQVSEIFGTEEPFSVLLRPDNYIGFVSPGISLSQLRTYLNQYVGYERAQVSANAN